MGSRLIGRVAQILPTIFLVTLLVFCLQQLMPGDPAVVMAGENRGDPAVLAQIRSELWLDRSLPVQYLHWIGNLLRGDLGISWHTRESVTGLIGPKLPVTLQVAPMAFAIASLRAGAEIVIDDPGAYTAKWSFPLLFEFLPDTEMIEDLCDNERDSRHSVGK